MDFDKMGITELESQYREIRAKSVQEPENSELQHLLAGISMQLKRSRELHDGILEYDRMLQQKRNGGA